MEAYRTLVSPPTGCVRTDTKFRKNGWHRRCSTGGEIYTAAALIYIPAGDAETSGAT